MCFTTPFFGSLAHAHAVHASPSGYLIAVVVGGAVGLFSAYTWRRFVSLAATLERSWVLSAFLAFIAAIFVGLGLSIGGAFIAIEIVGGFSRAWTGAV